MATWTKSDSACEQVDAAIGLLADKKFIAAHTLTSAAAELATAVARASGRKTNDLIFEETIKRLAPERFGEVQKALRRPQNFAKHADKDPEETIEVNLSSRFFGYSLL